jgi:isoamyl acetate esterase
MTTSPSLSSAHKASPSTKMYPQFLLFGDSITQGSSHTLIPSLSDYYSRRLDVLNRGFGGYNAPAGLDCLEHFFPVHRPSPRNPHVRLMTVFFGANDACIPGDPQHIPLEEYKDALRQIAGYEGVKLHSTKLIFITPGPVDEWQLETPNRNAAHTAIYAAACLDVAAELDVLCIDLWTIFMRKAGWKPGSELVGSRHARKSKVFEELLYDGLHFTEKAYGVVYQELIKLIERNLPSETPDKLPWVFPDWQDFMGV